MKDAFDQFAEFCQKNGGLNTALPSGGLLYFKTGATCTEGVPDGHPGHFSGPPSQPIPRLKLQIVHEELRQHRIATNQRQIMQHITDLSKNHKLNAGPLPGQNVYADLLNNKHLLKQSTLRLTLLKMALESISGPTSFDMRQQQTQAKIQDAETAQAIAGRLLDAKTPEDEAMILAEADMSLDPAKTHFGAYVPQIEPPAPEPLPTQIPDLQSTGDTSDARTDPKRDGLQPDADAELPMPEVQAGSERRRKRA